MSGLDRLLSEQKLPHPGAKIGFLGHHASITKNGQHAIDALIERKEWEILKLFSPEHGFFGDAGPGEKVQHFTHPKWKIPVYSLYGENRSPQKEWLEDLDLIVIDLQDLGVRCYTYASTLCLMLKACADAQINVLVLDRPTPLQGCVDGPDLSIKHSSFVGMIDLPLVYGLGQGKLAMFLKSQEKSLQHLKLEVVFGIPPHGITPRWTPPSPAIVSPESALLYPLTVWCEAIPDIWVDREGKNSFQIWLMPDFPEDLLNTPLEMRGVTAEPYASHTPTGVWKGFQFTITDQKLYRPVACAVQLLCALRDRLGNDRLFRSPEARPEFFDQLMGTSSVREKILAGLNAEQVVTGWSSDLPSTKVVF